MTEQDIKQITEHGLTPEIVLSQINDFINGFAYIDLTAPASVGNGIIQTTDIQRKHYAAIYDEYAKNHNVIKFVPASGAATRMFKDFFDFVKTGIPNTATDIAAANIEKFAFGSEVKTIADIVEKYGAEPKALIPFHKYPNGNRTPLEEHLVEAKHTGIKKIHFTVSPEHRDGFETLLKKYAAEYEITMSEQKSSTDTIAVNPDNTPFRENGKLVFRPAGHGALIENLNDLDADIIFIKNIDNVTTDARRSDTIEYKKTLAGILVLLQEKIFKYLRDDNADMTEIGKFIENDLFIRNANPSDYRKILNRPLRVCGMVRNDGEPGGGPFWVRGRLQIVESSQIAPADKHIMQESTHFNPVDLVCGVRDYMGERFNLNDFIDRETGFISEKSKDGVPLRALERPGLWNGAMSDWNTIFVEVPISTFTPVKTANDLLRDVHI